MEVQDSVLSQISEDGDVNFEDTVYVHALDTKQKGEFLFQKLLWLYNPWKIL